MPGPVPGGGIAVVRMPFVPVTGAGASTVSASMPTSRAIIRSSLTTWSVLGRSTGSPRGLAAGRRPRRPGGGGGRAAGRAGQVRRDVRRAAQACDGRLEGVAGVLPARGDALQEHEAEGVHVG